MEKHAQYTAEKADNIFSHASEEDLEHEASKMNTFTLREDRDASYHCLSCIRALGDGNRPSRKRTHRELRCIDVSVLELVTVYFYCSS